MPEKYQEEIEEILRGLGESERPNSGQQSAKPPDDAPVAYRPAPPTTPPPQGAKGFWPRVTPGKLAIIGLVLLVVGAFWVRPLVWVGLSFLVGAYLLFFVRPRSISMEKRWRGKSMEDQATTWDKFKKWLKS